MTPLEYARKHRIPHSTAKRWIRLGLVPGVVRHGKTYIVPDDAPRIYLKPGIKPGQKISRQHKKN